MTYYSYYKVNMLSYARSLLMFYSLRHIAPESKFTHALHLDLFEHLIPPSLIGEVLTETHAVCRFSISASRASCSCAAVAAGSST